MAASDPALAFEALVQASKPRAAPLPSSKFVKKLDEIPTVELSSSEPCRIAVQLAENALTGKFTGLWPSPKSVEIWMAEHWKPLLQGPITLFAAGRGYFVFLFSSKEEKDRVFRSGPFFMGSRGMFLAPWTLDFNPEEEITEAPIWVRLPHLPLHLWGKSSLEDIGNKLGRFLDSSEPKGGLFNCARICVEINLEKGLPEALKLTKGNWSHIQELDYEQIPFKCISCHIYGHFAKNCPKLSENQKASPPASAEAGFQTVTRRKGARCQEASGSQPRNKEPASLKSKNSFETLQEAEVLVSEASVAEEEPSPAEKLPGPSDPADATDVPEVGDLAEPSKLVDPPSVVSVDHIGKDASPNTATQAAQKDARTPEPELQEGFILASIAGCPATTGYLTRGRKTNRERRENEAAMNLSRGSQKQLDPYLKGRH